MNKLIIYIGFLLVLIGVVAANEISATSNTPITSSEELRVTYTLNSQSNVKLWKVKDIVVPSGWTYIDKEVTGASGPDHNELCSTQDDGKFGCSIFAETGSTVAKTLTLRYNVASDIDAATHVGKWEIYTGNPSILSDSGTFGGGNGGGGSDSGMGNMWIWLIGAGVAVIVLFTMNKK